MSFNGTDWSCTPAVALTYGPEGSTNAPGTSQYSAFGTPLTYSWGYISGWMPNTFPPVTPAGGSTLAIGDGDSATVQVSTWTGLHAGLDERAGLPARFLSSGTRGHHPLIRVHSGGMSPSTVGPLVNHGSGAMTGVPLGAIQAPHQLKVELAMTTAAA